MYIESISFPASATMEREERGGGKGAPLAAKTQRKQGRNKVFGLCLLRHK